MRFDIRALHEHDLEEGYGEVYLPFAMASQRPNAYREWHWQYVFRAATRAFEPRIVEENQSGHYQDQSIVNKALKRAVGLARIH